MEYQLALELRDIRLDSMVRITDTRPLAEIAFPVMHRALIDCIGDIFAEEGRPPWEPLAERTILERLRLGFDEGPILHRTGSLRASFTEESHPLHVFDMEFSERVSTLRVGSIDPRAVDLASGNPETHLPARPMLPNPTVVFPEMWDIIVDAAEAIYG